MDVTVDQDRMILVVDDDARILDLVCKLLESAGFSTEKAANGLEGLKQFSLRPPKLVILDVNMPELDGMQTCRMIRAQEKFNTIPILMLTSRSDISDMIEARRMGADDYLLKPFDSEALLGKIERLLSR